MADTDFPNGTCYPWTENKKIVCIHTRRKIDYLLGFYRKQDIISIGGWPPPHSFFIIGSCLNKRFWLLENIATQKRNNISVTSSLDQPENLSLTRPSIFAPTLSQLKRHILLQTDFFLLPCIFLCSMADLKWVKPIFVNMKNATEVNELSKPENKRTELFAIYFIFWCTKLFCLNVCLCMRMRVFTF